MDNKIIGLMVSVSEANLIFDSLDKTAKVLTDLKEKLYQDGLRQLTLLNQTHEPQQEQIQQGSEQSKILLEEIPEKENKISKEKRRN